MKRLRWLVLLVATACLLIACKTGDPVNRSATVTERASTQADQSADQSSQNRSISQLLADLPSASLDQSAFPLSVENCDRTLTFTQPPQRVISLWQPPNELLLALGLEESLIGLAGNYTELPSPLADSAKDIPELGSGMRWPAREAMLTQQPDLVVSEGLTGFAFDPAQGYATVADLEAAGAQVISTGSSCNPTESAGRGITAVYDDLRLLASVFGVSARGEALVERMQQREAQITQQVESLAPVPTAFYNGGEGPLSVLTSGVWEDLIRKAGGNSVFDEEIFQVGLEAFANSGAEVILMGTYPGQDSAVMSAFLKDTFPALPAVQNNRLYPIPTIETEAGIRIIDGLGKIARALHPSAF